MGGTGSGVRRKRRVEPEPAANYPYTIDQRREKGESVVYRVMRAGTTVLCFEPRQRLYDIARDVVHYLNRDRREIVFVEDRMHQAERRLAEIAKLAGLLVGNLEWCRENMNRSQDSKLVDIWARKAQAILDEVMGPRWK